MKEIPIILASTSPQRSELLKRLRINFKVVASNYNEDMSAKLSPRKLAKFLSLGKAKNVAGRFPNSIIISADTFIALGKEALGKPKNKVEGKKMLQKLSGRWLQIITGLTIIDTRSNRIITEAEVGKVKFRTLEKGEIEKYLASGEPMDKAGAFAIQGLGSIFIEKMIGDYHSMFGLPLYLLAKNLRKLGIKIL